MLWPVPPSGHRAFRVHLRKSSDVVEESGTASFDAGQGDRVWRTAGPNHEQVEGMMGGSCFDPEARGQLSILIFDRAGGHLGAEEAAVAVQLRTATIPLFPELSLCVGYAQCCSPRSRRRGRQQTADSGECCSLGRDLVPSKLSPAHAGSQLRCFQAVMHPSCAPLRVLRMQSHTCLERC